MARALLLTTLLFLSLPALARDREVSFLAMDVWIDSGDQPLAAYQVEIRYDKRTTKIVGIEGGATKAFNGAPHYDAKGMEGGRIVLAAFTKDDEAAPIGNSRVGRIHLQVEGLQEPALSIQLISAATTGGDRIKPKPQFKNSKTEEGE